MRHNKDKPVNLAVILEKIFDGFNIQNFQN